MPDPFLQRAGPVWLALALRPGTQKLMCGWGWTKRTAIKNYKRIFEEEGVWESN